MRLNNFIALVANDLIECMLIEQATLTVPTEDLLNISVFGFNADVDCAVGHFNDYRIEELFFFIVIVMV